MDHEKIEGEYVPALSFEPIVVDEQYSYVLMSLNEGLQFGLQVTGMAVPILVLAGVGYIGFRWIKRLLRPDITPSQAESRTLKVEITVVKQEVVAKDVD